MAGDWIPMRTDLWDCPEVVRILSALCPDFVRDPSKAVRVKSEIVGAMFRTWSLFDTYTSDGVLEGYTAETLDITVGIEGWASHLERVGWLAIEPQRLVMPSFDAWLSSSAKARLKDAQRKRNERKQPPADRPNPVQNFPDKNRTTGEERRVSETETETETEGEPGTIQTDLAEHTAAQIDPLPIGSMRPSAVFEILKPEHLRQPKAVISWFRRQLSAISPVLPGTRAYLIFALCCAKRASGRGVKEPVGSFVSLINGKNWAAVRRYRDEAERDAMAELKQEAVA